MVKENTELNDKTILIGKINSSLTTKDVWTDDSVKPKKGQLGYVDKSNWIVLSVTPKVRKQILEKLKFKDSHIVLIRIYALP